MVARGGGRRERRDRGGRRRKGQEKEKGKKEKIWMSINVLYWVLDTAMCLNFKEGT